MMLSSVKNKRLFLLCAFFSSTSFLLAELPQKSLDLTSESTHKPDPQALTKVLDSAMKAIFAVKNSFAMTVKLTKKFGKNVKNKDVVVKKIFDAIESFDTYIALKTKSIQHYFQQNPNSIPTEAYQEIYGTYDAIIKTATQLVHELNNTVQNGFTKEFCFDFLHTKDALLIDEQVKPETVIHRAEQLQGAAEKLFESSNSIGLTRYNKACRAIDKYVVQPCHKYHVLKTVGYGTFVTCAALFYYWYTFGKAAPSKLEKATEEANLTSVNNSNEHTQFPTLKMEKPIDTPSPEEESSKPAEPIWFSSFRNGFYKQVTDFCGTKPTVAKDGSWVVNKDEAPDTQATPWNKTFALAHNILQQNPISNVFFAGFALIFNSEVKPIFWPIIKNSIKNWWQQSLGGSHADMEQRGTFEVPAEITFDHVIGLEPFKERLAPAIAYAQDPAKYAQIGSDIATNYIFYGIKRTGKSFFANAVSGEMKKVNPQMRILNVPCALFASLGVQETIDLIRSYAPCVAFVDEIDIAGTNRGMDRATTGELLKAMGKGNISPSPDKPVFLIFATNKLESIDTSLASLGRFGAAILFTPPSFIDRIQFVYAILQTAGQNPENFDIQRLAEKTEGNSFEDVKYCVTQAALIASLRNTPLTTELIVEVMNEILEGLYPEYPIELDTETRNVISAHFAGKALITLLTESYEKLDSVSIHRRKLPVSEEEWSGFSGKPTRQLKFEYGTLLKRQQTITENILGPKTRKAKIMRLLAGPMAEEMILGESTYSCHATPLVYAYEDLIAQCSEGGIAYRLESVMSNDQKGKYFEKALAIMEEYKKEVRELLTQHNKALEVLTRALMLPALGGNATAELVAAIIENPDTINAEIDILEKKQIEFEQQQREQYARMREEQMANKVSTHTIEHEIESAKTVPIIEQQSVA